MRTFVLFSLLIPLFLLAAEEQKPAAEKRPSEATVLFEKKADGTLYTIAILPPFKFELRKSEQELITALDLSAFKKDEKDETYRYTSTAGEKRLHYWFIACKYKGDEVVACKTFAAKQDLP